MIEHLALDLIEESLVSLTGEVLSYMKSKYMTKIAICLIS
jgi:hypothetical protein